MRVKEEFLGDGGRKKRKRRINNFAMAHVTVGFQALLALQLVMMFFEAGHADT